MEILKYIFDKNDPNYPRGKFPIDHFQLCWYDMEKNQKCFDEDIIKPNEFKVNFYTYIDTDENEGDSDRSRVFVHHVNGDIYELRLHKLTKEQWSKCKKFYGGRDK